LVTTIAVVTTKVEKEKAETIISITGGHRVIQQATNLVEVLLSKFYCCAYTSFDIDLQQIIIEYLQCIEFASPLRKFHMNTPPPFIFSFSAQIIVTTTTTMIIILILIWL
jgi:hypothetical protein